MAQTVLTAHVVVDFGSDSEANVSVEVDDRVNGYNGGNTSFAPGATPHLLLFKPTGYAVSAIYTSAGYCVKVADDVKVIEDEFAEFPNTDDVSLSYPHKDQFTYQWLGNNLGVLNPVSQYKAVLPQRTLDPLTQKPVPEYRVGVAKIGYRADCEVYKVYGVPMDVEKVMIFFVVTKL